jgi:DNA (cytosine-5)-methyltransferase 1
MEQIDMFQTAPKLDLEFNEPRINFGDLGTMTDEHQDRKTVQTARKYWNDCKKGNSFSTVSGGSFFNWCRLNENEVAPTMHTETRMMYHPDIMRPVNEKECKLISTFPMDYNFLNNKLGYLMGMSVPPVMVAQVASNIYQQWISKF